MNQEDIEALEEICEDAHSLCNDVCPVYEKNGGVLDLGDRRFERHGCSAYAEGDTMLKFLRRGLE